MLDALAHLTRCWDPATPGVLATVVSQEGSAPLDVGTSMTVDAAGVIHGSISGGCVDGDVYETALEVLRTGAPVLRRYSAQDGDPFAVSLTCGGTIEVLLQRLDPGSLLRTTPWGSSRHVRCAVAVVLDSAVPQDVGAMLACAGDTWDGTVRSPALEARLTREMGRYDSGGTRSYTDLPGAPRVFVWTSPPPPRMVLIGANNVAAAVCRLAAEVGYAVTVCDQRAVFAEPAQFPEARDVVVEWPHRYLEAEAAAGRLDASTVVCVLTHDERVDAPSLRTALRLDQVGYVGAMGSRTTHLDRLGRLQSLGVTPAELSRLCSPIGLDLGGRTPQEIAISILAEVIAMRRSASGQRLALQTGPIHARPQRARTA